MKDTYLMVNGQKIELTAEQKRQLGIVEEQKQNCFDRAGQYYYIGDNDTIKENIDGFEGSISRFYANERYSIANYCTDKDIMYQRAMHETLNRLLWRYSMTHDGDKIDWNKISSPKYSIYYNSRHLCFDIHTFGSHKEEGVVHFNDKQTAYDAIEEIIKPFMKEHPDFVW